MVPKGRARARRQEARARARTPVDTFLASVRADRRPLLQALRKQIRAVVPGAEECLSYGLAAFRVDGEIVAGFQATAKGCSYYPFGGNTLAALAKELEAYSRTRSALHFGKDRPLPASLVRKLLKARLAEIRGARGPRAGRSS
jgi:uncharacterized protein YdhG (YjbR/CyaY superfamily)